MKNRFLLLICILFCSTKLFCQDETDKTESWTPEFGYTQQFFGSTLKGYDFRIISPRFKIESEDDYWSEEEEKHPDEFKQARFYFDFMYAGPHVDSLFFEEVSEYSASADLLYSLFHNKRFSFDVLGGMRFYFQIAPNYGIVNFKKVYYWDLGLSAQMKLGFISPFIDIHRLGYYTIGAEFTLHSVYKKQHKKYKAHKKLG